MVYLITIIEFTVNNVIYYNIISLNNFMVYKLTLISIRGLHISILSVYSKYNFKETKFKNVNQLL